jgi:hypothetical protein
MSMQPDRGQTEQINDLRAENRALEAQRAAQQLPAELRAVRVEPTPEPAGNDARRWVGWWPGLAGLALAIIVAVIVLLAVR